MPVSRGYMRALYPLLMAPLTKFSKLFFANFTFGLGTWVPKGLHCLSIVWQGVNKFCHPRVWCLYSNSVHSLVTLIWAKGVVQDNFSKNAFLTTF